MDLQLPFDFGFGELPLARRTGLPLTGYFFFTFFPKKTRNYFNPMLLILVQLEQLEWAATATNRTVYVSPIQHFLQPSFVNHEEISQEKYTTQEIFSCRSEAAQLSTVISKKRSGSMRP